MSTITIVVLVNQLLRWSFSEKQMSRFYELQYG